MLLRFSCIFPPKNHQKTLPKRSPNPSKIDAENVSIFNIDFLRFWPQFGRLLGLQDGAKLAKKQQKTLRGFLFWRSQVKCLLKIASWRAPGSMLEAPGLDFGGSGNDFLRFLQVFWHVASKTSLPYSLQKSLRRSLPCWLSLIHI